MLKTRDMVSNWLQPPPTNIKYLELTNPWKVFANFWICFIKRPFLNFGFYPPAVNSLLTTGHWHWWKLVAMFEKPNQQIYFRLCCNGAFSCGVPTFVWLLMRCDQNWCLYLWGAYFLWVPTWTAMLLFSWKAMEVIMRVLLIFNINHFVTMGIWSRLKVITPYTHFRLT